MRVKLQFFGPAREAAGRVQETLELPGPAAVADAVRMARQRWPGLAALDGARLRFAVNAGYVDDRAALQDGDVLSFIPPVGGG